jgi:hypothetical protein
MNPYQDCYEQAHAPLIAYDPKDTLPPMILEDYMANATPDPSPLNKQVGGDHYKKLKIQPIEYILANGLPYIEGNIVKYISRWKDKGGVKDLEKIKHYVDILIEEETKGNR